MSSSRAVRSSMRLGSPEENSPVEQVALTVPVGDRPGDAGADVPDMGAGHGVLRRAVLPQHLLLVPQGAAHRHGHLGADRRRAARPPHGRRAAGARLLPWPAVGIHPQPWPVQRQGARAQHHLRQRRCRFRLRH